MSASEKRMLNVNSRTISVKNWQNLRSNQWRQSFFVSVVIVLVISVLIKPYRWDLAIISLISLPIVIMPLLMYMNTKSLLHITIVLPIFMTWFYFLNPFLLSDPITHSYRIIPEEFLFTMALYSALSLLAMFLGYYFTLRNYTFGGLRIPAVRFNTRTIGNLTLLMIFLGLIGEYIGRIFQQTKNRPLFIIKEVARPAEPSGSRVGLPLNG